MSLLYAFYKLAIFSISQNFFRILLKKASISVGKKNILRICYCRMSPLGLNLWAERAGSRRHLLQEQSFFILGIISGWFLVFYVPGPRCSRNGSGLYPDLQIQKKFVMFRKSTQNSGVCLTELTDNFFVTLPCISPDTWKIYSSLILGMVGICDWLFLGDSTWLSLATAVNNLLFPKDTIFEGETVERFWGLKKVLKDFNFENKNRQKWQIDFVKTMTSDKQDCWKHDEYWYFQFSSLYLFLGGKHNFLHIQGYKVGKIALIKSLQMKKSQPDGKQTPFQPFRSSFAASFLCSGKKGAGSIGRKLISKCFFRHRHKNNY